jgi:hypothetical protein
MQITMNESDQGGRRGSDSFRVASYTRLAVYLCIRAFAIRTALMASRSKAVSETREIQLRMLFCHFRDDVDDGADRAVSNVVPFLWTKSCLKGFEIKLGKTKQLTITAYGLCEGDCRFAAKFNTVFVVSW